MSTRHPFCSEEKCKDNKDKIDNCIICPGYTSIFWVNKLLSHESYIDTKTWEFLENNKYAVDKSLTLEVLVNLPYDDIKKLCIWIMSI